MMDYSVNNGKAIIIQKSGVADISEYNGSIRVNSENMIAELENEIQKAKPKKDYNSCFAARVTVAIEFLGDMENDDADCSDVPDGG